jgi:hypothetical protein
MPVSATAGRVLRLFAVTAVTFGALGSRTALAAEPTVDACVDANEEAQDLRLAGELLEARERLAVCISPRCPAPVRDDCVGRLRAVDEATPTIAFATAPGLDPQGMTITLDGRPIAASATAGPIAVDPGAHEVVFDWAGHAPQTDTVVVREGEKDHRVDLPPPAPSHSEAGSVQRPVGLVVGGVGLAGLAVGGVLAALAKSTDARALGDECGGDSNTCSAAGVRDGDRAHAQARSATIALVGGGVLLGAGAVIYFMAPGGHRASFGATGGAGRAGLSLSGDF